VCEKGLQGDALIAVRKNKEVLFSEKEGKGFQERGGGNSRRGGGTPSLLSLSAGEEGKSFLRVVSGKREGGVPRYSEKEQNKKYGRRPA